MRPTTVESLVNLMIGLVKKKKKTHDPIVNPGNYVTRADWLMARMDPPTSSSGALIPESTVSQPCCLLGARSSHPVTESKLKKLRVAARVSRARERFQASRTDPRESSSKPLAADTELVTPTQNET